MRFFKARSYERDFRDLNSLLNEALGDLQMALTGEIHRAVVDVQVVSDDVLERFRNEFLSHVESRFDHVDGSATGVGRNAVSFEGAARADDGRT